MTAEQTGNSMLFKKSPVLSQTIMAVQKHPVIVRTTSRRLKDVSLPFISLSAVSESFGWVSRHLLHVGFLSRLMDFPLGI